MNTIQSRILAVFLLFFVLASLNLYLTHTSGQELSGINISLSGKLRMLSQQFVSLCHELYREPENETVRKELRATIALFSKTKLELHENMKGESSINRNGNWTFQYYANIDQTWSVLQPNVMLLLDEKSRQSSAAVDYIIDNEIKLAEQMGTILVLSEEKVSESNSEGSDLVELYGIVGLLSRQMMRVQGIIKNVVRLNGTPDTHSLKSLLAEDLSFFNEIYDEFFDEESYPLLTNNESIAKELEKLDTIWGPVNEKIDQFIEFNDFNIDREKALKFIFQKRSALLQATNGLTEAFEQESRNIAKWYKNFSLIVVSLSLLSILVGWMSIIKPVLKIVKSVVKGLTLSTNNLAELSQHLSSTNRTLSEATTIQASNIKTSSTAMDEITAMTKKNSKKASTSKSLVLESRDALSLEGEFIEKVEASMAEIVEVFVHAIKIIDTMEGLFDEMDLWPTSASIVSTDSENVDESLSLRMRGIEDQLNKTKESVRNSRKLIDVINERLWEGDTQVTNLKKQFEKHNESFSGIVELMTNIEKSSHFQATKCSSISETLHELGFYASQNVKTSRFVAHSSDQLLLQTDRLKMVISNLVKLTGLEQVNKTSKNSKKPVA